MENEMKALIITGRHATDAEFIYPYYRLQEAGYEVDVAVKGKETVLGEKGWKIVPTHDISDIMTSVHDILILPGGAKCMEYLRQDQDALAFISFFAVYGKKNGVLGSICHAAQLLISAGLVKGRRISGYYSIKDDINNAGGTYVDEPFVTDGRIVTTAHYKHLGPWMKEILRLSGTLDAQRYVLVDKPRGVGEGDYGVE
jgi:protease I